MSVLVILISGRVIHCHLFIFPSAWIPESELFPYVEFCNKFKKPSIRKGFAEAIREAEEILSKTQRAMIKKMDVIDHQVITPVYVKS